MISYHYEFFWDLKKRHIYSNIYFLQCTGETVIAILYLKIHLATMLLGDVLAVLPGHLVLLLVLGGGAGHLHLLTLNLLALLLRNLTILHLVVQLYHNNHIYSI